MFRPLPSLSCQWNLTQTKYSSFSRKFKLIYSNGGCASSLPGRGSWYTTQENLWQIVCELCVLWPPHPIFTGYQSVILTLILGGLWYNTDRTYLHSNKPTVVLLLLSPLIRRESVRCRIGVNFLLLGQITSLYNEHIRHYPSWDHTNQFSVSPELGPM